MAGVLEISHLELRIIMYWQFVKEIWNNPTDHKIRLVFADWLEQSGMLAAANKQKVFAGVIENSIEMYWIKYYEQIYGKIIRKNRRVQTYRMKKDSTIVFQPYTFNFLWMSPGVFLHRIK